MTRALNEAQRSALHAQIPLGRLGDAGRHRGGGGVPGRRPSAAYITGETLHVNGGMYMA